MTEFNYVTEDDVKIIGGLMRLLNANFLDRDGPADVDAEVALSDSNGDSLGNLQWREGGFIWEFPGA